MGDQRCTLCYGDKFVCMSNRNDTLTVWYSPRHCPVNNQIPHVHTLQPCPRCSQEE